MVRTAGGRCMSSGLPGTFGNTWRERTSSLNRLQRTGSAAGAAGRTVACLAAP
jgi:hypothetical protein